MKKTIFKSMDPRDRAELLMEIQEHMLSCDIKFSQAIKLLDKFRERETNINKPVWAIDNKAATPSSVR